MTACVLAVAVSGCGLDDFEVVIEDDAVVQGTFGSGVPTGLMFGGDFNGLDLSTERTFNDQGVSPGDIDAIFVKSVQIVAISPADTRLDPFLSAVTLTVNADGQPPLQFGQATLQDGVEVRTLNLDVMSMENLKRYAVAGKMTLGANVSVKQAPLFSTTLRTTITLNVDVDVLGF